MKHAYSNILKMVIFSFTTNTFALNVVQGWYAGLLLGPTYTPTVYSPALAQTALNAVANAGTTTGLPTTPTTGELQYKILGYTYSALVGKFDVRTSEARCHFWSFAVQTGMEPSITNAATKVRLE